jgi:hypothetical protein
MKSLNWSKNKNITPRQISRECVEEYNCTIEAYENKNIEELKAIQKCTSKLVDDLKQIASNNKAITRMYILTAVQLDAIKFLINKKN